MDLRKPQCQLMTGFENTFRRTDKGVGIVADITHKILVRPSLHEILDDAYQKGQNLESFFDEHFRDKTAIVSYSKRFIKMVSIDVNEDEKTRFEKRDGEKISYGRYVKERYGEVVQFNEKCVIKTASGAAFLPQFLNITADNDMIGNDGIEGTYDAFVCPCDSPVICPHIPFNEFQIRNPRD